MPCGWRSATTWTSIRESPLHVTLAQGISRGERMDVVVQKATELGVKRIVPVLAERTVVRLNDAQAANRLRHWRAIAVAACEQCGRNRLPEITSPMSLQEFLVSDVSGRAAPGAESRPAVPGRGTCPPARAATLLIGPEGGLSDAEQAAALARSSRAWCWVRASCAPRPRRWRRSPSSSSSWGICIGRTGLRT